LHFLPASLGLLALSLLLSAFFSGSETAFMAVNRLRLRHRAESGDRRAVLVKRITDDPDRFLGVILLGNTIANIAAATILTYIVTTLSPAAHSRTLSLLASVALTLFILVFCELAPKTFAASHAETAADKLVRPVNAAIFLLHPFARLGAAIASVLFRLFGVSSSASPFAHALSEEEVRALIAASGSSDLAEHRRAMLRRVFDIGSTQIREVMIPRTEVTAVDIDSPLGEILSVLAKTSYSRIPVYRGSFENLLGLLHAKDLLPYLDRPGDIDIRALLRPVHYIPDTARLEAVLRSMQRMHLHMAAVVDEYGGVEGIVTLEDLLEEIVGEIRDEHDVEVEPIRELGADQYLVAGNLPVREFNRAFHARIPESHEYTTVAGFLQSLTGRLLQQGENIRYQGLDFTVEKTEGFKVVTIRFRRPAPPKADATGPVSPRRKQQPGRPPAPPGP